MTNQTQLTDLPVAINQPARGFVSIGIKELWDYRELMYYLVWRDVKVRYKQTILGVSWAVLQPLMTMVVFTVIFGNFAEMPSDDLPYAVFNFIALVPWTYFTNAISTSSMSLVTSSNMLKKVYFPRLILPIAGVMSGLVDFVLAFGVLILLILFYGVPLSANIIFLPFFLILAILPALGFSLWASLLNVQFRDVRHATPFILRLWLFITPVIYPLSMIDDKWQWLYKLNPMTSVIEGFRWALVDSGSQPDSSIIVGFIFSVLLVITGAIYFKRSEGFFADVA